MEEKNKELKILLQDVDREFYRLDPVMQAKFAIEQINMWQQKFNEAKHKVPIENFVHATHEAKIINQYAEIEA
ncbi:Uncharacterised protein [uncultured archaeon]|nr:Uncharacterised protein [uncultured archaeon]